jgi:hypothetical protein
VAQAGRRARAPGWRRSRPAGGGAAVSSAVVANPGGRPPAPLPRPSSSLALSRFDERSSPRAKPRFPKTGNAPDRQSPSRRRAAPRRAAPCRAAPRGVSRVRARQSVTA